MGHMFCFSYMKEIDFGKKVHHEVILNVYNKMQFLDSMFFKCHTVADFPRLDLCP